MSFILQVIMLRMKKVGQIRKLVKLMPFVILGFAIVNLEINRENYKENQLIQLSIILFSSIYMMLATHISFGFIQKSFIVLFYILYYTLRIYSQEGTLMIPKGSFNIALMFVILASFFYLNELNIKKIIIKNKIQLKEEKSWKNLLQ